MPPSTATAKVTTDHELIRRWVESRGGHPATVKRTRRGREPGLLRIDYPGFSGEKALQEIGWDEFFDKFEESGLAFIYQDKTASGRPSRFAKLVSRDTVADRLGRGRGSRRKSAAGASRSNGQARGRKTGKRKAAGGTARRKSGTQRTARRAGAAAKRRTRRTGSS
jgi:hypothetical protein